MNHKNAKEIFMQYRGSHFQMEREGVYDEYKSYAITKATEQEWLKELIIQFYHEFKESDMPTVQYGQICTIIRQGKFSDLLDVAERMLDIIIQTCDGYTALVATGTFADTLNYFERKSVNVDRMKSSLRSKIYEQEIREPSLQERLNKICERLG